MELLKELSKRRETLDKEKADLNVREQVLKATENKIDKKVSELKTLQTQLEELMKQYEQKENSKILSLVKIYEAMKPKDAAKIFNELEMPVLLKVVSNMKEVKVAPVIASMDPVKARELSIELSKQKPIG
jgi:flagellar motility protein MotE (MotC chaperone)